MNDAGGLLHELLCAYGVGGLANTLLLADSPGIAIRENPQNLSDPFSLFFHGLRKSKAKFLGGYCQHQMERKAKKSFRRMVGVVVSDGKAIGAEAETPIVDETRRSMEAALNGELANDDDRMIWSYPRTIFVNLQWAS